MQEVEYGVLDCKCYVSSYGYFFFDLIFCFDYLIKFEGFMMEILEQFYWKYYENDGKNIVGKNEDFCKGFKVLAECLVEDFYWEMYWGCSIFGIMYIVNYDCVVFIINGELYYMDWYLENGYECMVMAIFGYIVGFCLFNYVVFKFDCDFFYLYYQIIELAYFGDFGFIVKYLDDSI